MVVVVVASAIVLSGCAGSRNDGASTSNTGGSTIQSTTGSTTQRSDSATVDSEPGSRPSTGGSLASQTTSAPTDSIPVEPNDSTPHSPTGFSATTATIIEADGSTHDVCLWLAITDAERELGLMYVTDLGAADGMAFFWETPYTGLFWMKNTVLPLTIVFYGPSSTTSSSSSPDSPPIPSLPLEYLGGFDMEPCLTESCPTYQTASNFTVAVEFEQGTAAKFGATPDSRLQFSDVPCAQSSGA